MRCGYAYIMYIFSELIKSEVTSILELDKY